MAERTASNQSGTTLPGFDQQQNSYALAGGYKNGPWGMQVRYAKANDVQGSAVADTGAQQLAVATTYQIHKFVKVIGSSAASAMTEMRTSPRLPALHWTRATA